MTKSISSTRVSTNAPRYLSDSSRMPNRCPASRYGCRNRAPAGVPSEALFFNALEITLPSPSRLLRQRTRSRGGSGRSCAVMPQISPAAKRAYELAGGVGALLLLGLAMGDLNSIILGDIQRDVVGEGWILLHALSVIPPFTYLAGLLQLTNWPVSISTLYLNRIACSITPFGVAERPGRPRVNVRPSQ